MPIPQTINEDHVLEALAEIDQEGEPERQQSRKYKLVHDGGQYSPKYVIRVANKYANGRKLTPGGEDSFEGGRDLTVHQHKPSCKEHHANCFLDSLGFEIRKMSR